MGLYYAQIRSLLRERPDLRPYLKRCRHCGILFFTDPRNAAREDLRCGFGCREAHRRACSAQRTAEFYREFPEKKRCQNRKRYLRSLPPRQDGAAEPRGACPAPIVRHVRVIVSMIEGRQVGVAEIIALLSKKGRQHRMARRRRGAYGRRRIEGRGS